MKGVIILDECYGDIEISEERKKAIKEMFSKTIEGSRKKADGVPTIIITSRICDEHTENN